MFSETIKSKLNSPTVRKSATAILILLFVGATIWYNPAGRFVRTVSKTSVETTAKSQSRTLSDKELMDLLLTKIREESKTSTRANYADTGKTTTNNTTKITEITRVIERDPVTGKVVKETETNRNEDTGLSNTTEMASISGVDTSTVKTTDTDIAATLVTKETEDTAQVVTSTTKATEVVVTETATKPPSNSTTPIGLAVNVKGKPMLTYDLIKISRFSAAATVELDVKNTNVSAAGVGLLADINKRKDYFVGAYDQYVFKNKTTEFGVVFGRRF